VDAGEEGCRGTLVGDRVVEIGERLTCPIKITLTFLGEGEGTHQGKKLRTELSAEKKGGEREEERIQTIWGRHSTETILLDLNIG